MTDILFEDSYILIHSEYRTPDVHKHLASHLIVGLGDDMICEIAGRRIETCGVCIASDVEHTVYAPRGELLLFLFDMAGNMAAQLEREFLHGEQYVLLDQALLQQIRELWNGNEEKELAQLGKELLTLCGMVPQTTMQDARVAQVLASLRKMETVPEDIMQILCKSVCLSQSRLSHLFKEQVGISLHRYLALEKMRKGYLHYKAGGNITEAALMAGFDSPSHFASTCKRMFGITFSEFQKSMEK